MPLQPGGKISIGNIRSELITSIPTPSRNLNSADFRALAAPLSGLQLSHYYGKSNIPPSQDFYFNTSGIAGFILKANVRYISVYMAGGGGGGGGYDSGASGYPGGEGRYHQVVIDTSLLGSISIERQCYAYIGEGGYGGQQGTGSGGGAGGWGYLNGGRGGNAGWNGHSGGGGGGGGASALVIGGVLIALAGGGGGGGGAGSSGLYPTGLYGFSGLYPTDLYGSGHYYDNYYQGSWTNRGVTATFSDLAQGSAGGANIHDGGGAGGGGGGSGLGLTLYYGDGTYMLLPNPATPGLAYGYGFGYDNEWGQFDYNAAGGGGGFVYYNPAVTNVSNQGRYYTTAAKGGVMNSGNGTAGEVFIRTLYNSILLNNTSEIYPYCAPLQRLNPSSTWVDPNAAPPPPANNNGGA